MLMRWDPFRDLDRAADQLWNGSSGASRAFRGVPMDAYRRGEEFVIHFDVPGVHPDGIELTVEKNVLTVRAERQWEPREGDEILVHERPRGSFTRQLFLGDTLDAGRLEANVDQGVLTIKIPVAEAAKPRRVEVSANPSQSAQSIEATSSHAA
jgi:HSP20 family protein